MRRIIALVLFLGASVLPALAAADDFGPARDVGEVRTDARVLLAQRARLENVDPKNVVISDVVVVNTCALLSWDIGSRHGLMGMLRAGDRWWDAFEGSRLSAPPRPWLFNSFPPLPGRRDNRLYAAPTPAILSSFALPADLVSAASRHSTDLRMGGEKTSPIGHIAFESVPSAGVIFSSGGRYGAWRWETAGYALSISYARNDAPSATRISRIYGRAPTPAEFLGYPTPPDFGPNAVFFFDITIDGPKAVTFQPGTAIDVWFPFVIDDKLRYDVSISFADKPIGPISARAFDNALHFELPAFTVTPGTTLMAEIDGTLR